MTAAHEISAAKKSSIAEKR